MATRSPLNGNPRSRIVYRSSNAWVGCSCHPSPALISELFTPRASVSAAPADECLRTMISACIASILRAVSSNVSPLTTLLEEGEKLITSALNRLAASSNDVRVLVLGSKKRFTTVRPRNAGKLRRSFRFRLIAPSPSRFENDDPIVVSRLFQQYLNVFFA